jgi:MFS family permease
VLGGSSVLETIRATGQLAGPGLGGALVSLFGAATVVLVDAVSYLASALSLAAIRGGEPEWRRQRHASLRLEIGEGLRYVIGQPTLRAIALLSALLNFGFVAASAVTFIFLARELRLSAGVIGLLVSVGSAGAIAGAAAAPRLARRFGSARIIWLSLVATTPFTLLRPLAAAGWRVGLFAAGMAVFEFGQIVYSVTNVNLRLRTCPEHMLGRMNATMRVLILGAVPLGAVAGGALGTFVGVRATLWAIAALLVGSSLPLLRPLWGVRAVSDLRPIWVASAEPL